MYVHSIGGEYDLTENSISIGQVSGFLVMRYAYFEKKNQEKSLDDEVDPKSSFMVLAPTGLHQTKWKNTISVSFSIEFMFDD